MVSGIPGLLIRVVRGSVSRSHVNNSNLVNLGGVSWKMVQKLSLGSFCDFCVLQDLRVWKSEDGDGWRRLDDLILKVALVENVPLAILNQEDDTFLVSEFGLRRYIVSCLNTCCQAPSAGVFW